MARVKIPRRFEDQLQLANLILTKHNELGDKSPLKDAFDMKTFEADGKDANAHNSKKDEYEKLAEKETELRDNVWVGAVTIVRSIAQFLKAMYSKNPHELGEWGFEVDSSPQKKKEEE